MEFNVIKSYSLLARTSPLMPVKTLQSIFYLVNALRLPAKGNKCKFGG
jgi:hypothetical protein